MRVNCQVLWVIGVLLALAVFSEAKKPKDKPEWAKKDVRDFSDADLERLYDQWEEDDEPLPLDELPEHDPRRPQPSIDFSKLDMSNPESMMKATKKGKTLMMFVRVSGNPTRKETEDISSIWQTGLWNNHVQTDRFLLEDDRVIFMFKDGEMAWDAKDFLLNEERCEDVQLEQKTYCGKHSKTCEKEQIEKEAKDKKDKEKRDKKKKKDEEKKKKEEKKQKDGDKKKKDGNKKKKDKEEL